MPQIYIKNVMVDWMASKGKEIWEKRKRETRKSLDTCE